jgi:ferritin
MKNKKKCLISEEVGKLLIKQLQHELLNYNLYKTFANFFGAEGIIALETYYHERAHEEYDHHDWIFHYLTEADYIFEYPAIEANNIKAENYIQPFVDTVDREIQTTQLIYAIYDKCIEEKDYMTASWLFDKLIKEQIEEENTSRMALTIMGHDADIFERAKKVLELLKKA